MYQIEWIGHSCVIIKTPQASCIIDPFLDSNPNTTKKIKDLENIDLILLTHAHWDHISEAIPLAKKLDIPIVCVPELSYYLKQIDPTLKTIDMGIGGTLDLEKKLNISNISIKMVAALHSSSIMHNNQKYYAGLATGFVITLKIDNRLLHIYHAGDTALSYEMKLLGGKVHIALMPIDGHYNMGLDDLPTALEWIQPQVFIPIHYNTFPLIEVDSNKILDIENPYGSVSILNQENPIIDIDRI